MVLESLSLQPGRGGRVPLCACVICMSRPKTWPWYDLMVGKLGGLSF